MRSIEKGSVDSPGILDRALCKTTMASLWDCERRCTLTQHIITKSDRPFQCTAVNRIISK